MSAAASLLSVSSEVLYNIVILASDALGPPSEWAALVATCSALRRALDTPAMHALLFTNKFLFPADPEHARDELQRRFEALNFFRTVRPRPLGDDSVFLDALWVAYIMLKSEEPRQRNVDQLRWAGLPELLLQHLSQQLRGWPLVNETSALVIALLWLLSSEESVAAEPAAIRELVMNRLRPYVLAAFRYPLSDKGWCPYHSCSSEIAAASRTSTTTRPAAYSERQSKASNAIRIPAVPIYAILCYFTRLDTLSPMFPVHLSASSPRKRGPRREDVEHFINECRTPFEPWNSNSSPPLYRSLGPNVQYFPGALTGRWKGSSIVSPRFVPLSSSESPHQTPSINDYAHWKDADAVPESMDVFCRQPLYLTLQEHFCYDVAVRQDEDAPCLPLAGTWVEREDGITVDSWGPRDFERHHGMTPQREIFDVFVTGKTDDPYASAWGDFRIVGRVRLSDGLVVLSRESVAGLGTTVFRGYMTSPQNFCGRYRAVGGALHADWEAAFSLCKM